LSGAERIEAERLLAECDYKNELLKERLKTDPLYAFDSLPSDSLTAIHDELTLTVDSPDPRTKALACKALQTPFAEARTTCSAY
jgi:hypothetical protein